MLLSRKGVAAPANHPLRIAIERHKTRLNAELTKLRVRRGYASLQQFRSSIKTAIRGGGDDDTPNPRWVRINNARTTLQQELSSTFAEYTPVSSLTELAKCKVKGYYLDEHIPDLIAVLPTSQLLTTAAYKEGRIILQDKASCFPAYLLLGDQAARWHGDLIDGCAAPGNKTTHLASLLSAAGRTKDKIYSLDASPARSKILQKMVRIAGLDNRVNILAGQDFLALDPQDARFKNVTGLLLDPSCSGSGIVQREDVPQLELPELKARGSLAKAGSNSRKRKRKPDPPTPLVVQSSTSDKLENEPVEGEIDIARLTKLSNLQAQIVEHAFKFSSATKVTYSTCSIHAQENENVVSRVLASAVARERGWKILPRTEQVGGLRKWKHRGLRKSDHRPVNGEESWDLTDVESEACLRCSPKDGEGTGGFFVAGFVREDVPDLQKEAGEAEAVGVNVDSEDSNETWEGFDTD